jgi:hypothetical protein
MKINLILITEKRIAKLLYRLEKHKHSKKEENAIKKMIRREFTFLEYLDKEKEEE